MTDMPKEIYVWDSEDDGQRWTESNCFPDKQVKYIRADLAIGRDDLAAILFPEGIKHPQQLEPERLLQEIRSILQKMKQYREDKE